MKTSTKIWLCVAGVLLIALGVVCICNPAETLFSTAWLIGIFTLLAGISKLVFTFKTQAFIPNSGSRMLSALFEILMGCIFLGSKLFLTASLPIIFAAWVLVEGVIIAVQSFDYKQVGVPWWYCLLILGIAGAVLGLLGLRNPVTAGKTLSTLIGIGIIANGAAYILAVAGVNKFEKKVEGVRSTIREAIADEQ